MSINRIVFILLIFTINQSAFGFLLKTRHGKLYQDAHLREVTPTGLIIFNSGTIVTIDYRDLPVDLQIQFEYDAKKGRKNPQLAGQEAYQAWQRHVVDFRRQEAKMQTTHRAELARLTQERDLAARLSQKQREAGLLLRDTQRRDINSAKAQQEADASRNEEEVARQVTPTPQIAIASTALLASAYNPSAIRSPTVAQLAPEKTAKMSQSQKVGPDVTLIIFVIIGIIIFIISSIAPKSTAAEFSGQDTSRQGSSSPPPVNTSGEGDSSNDNSSRPLPPTPPPQQVRDEKYYATILGLSGKLTKNDLKRCYRELLMKYHPDKVQHLGKEFQDMAEQKAKQINEAYEFFRHRYNI